MNSLSKAGGVAALYLAAAYLAAMPYFLLVVNAPGLVDPAQKLAALIAHRDSMYAMEFVVYVLFGLCLVLLAMTLHQRIAPGATALMSVATPIAVIWAGLLIASGMIFNVGIAPVVAMSGKNPVEAAALWAAIDAVSSGLSGNGEIVGGAWMLLVCLAAARARALPRALRVLGLAIAAVALLSVVPALSVLAAVFGLGQIVWFIGLGFVLLRSERATG